MLLASGKLMHEEPSLLLNRGSNLRRRLGCHDICVMSGCWEEPGAELNTVAVGLQWQAAPPLSLLASSSRCHWLGTASPIFPLCSRRSQSLKPHHAVPARLQDESPLPSLATATGWGLLPPLLLHGSRRSRPLKPCHTWIHAWPPPPPGHSEHWGEQPPKKFLEGGKRAGPLRVCAYGCRVLPSALSLLGHIPTMH